LQEPGVALLTISPDFADDNPACLLVEARLRDKLLRVAARAWVRPNEADVRAQVAAWIASPAIDAIVICGEAHEAVAAGALSGLDDGSKRIVVMPTSLVDTITAVERFLHEVRGGVRAVVGRVPTDRIAIIGDLPSAALLVSLSPDLRAGGRRGLFVFGVVAVALFAAVAGVFASAGRQEASVVSAAEPSPQIVDESLPATKPPVDESRPAPAAVKPAAAPVAAPATPVAAKAAPAAAPASPAAAKHDAPAPTKRVAVPAQDPAEPAAAPVPVPVELQQATPADDDDTCTQDSCARHNNERECCAPFRDQQARTLDRAAIARATAGIKMKVRDCRDPQASDGVVRISVEVAPDGSVDKAFVLEAPEAGVGQCVASVVRGVAFPATAVGGSFVYRADLAAE